MAVTPNMEAALKGDKSKTAEIKESNSKFNLSGLVSKLMQAQQDAAAKYNESKSVATFQAINETLDKSKKREELIKQGISPEETDKQLGITKSDTTATDKQPETDENVNKDENFKQEQAYIENSKASDTSNSSFNSDGDSNQSSVDSSETSNNSRDAESTSSNGSSSSASSKGGSMNMKTNLGAMGLYGGLSTWANTIRGGVDPNHGNKETERDLKLENAQDLQKSAQRANAIANRNSFNEAGREGAFKSAAEDIEKARKGSSQMGSKNMSATLSRTPKVGDVQAYNQRADNRADKATDLEDASSSALQQANVADSEMKLADFKYRQMQGNNAESDQLSMGKPVVNGNEEKETEEPKPEEKPEEPKPEEPKPEEPKQIPSGNPQHVINALLGSSKGEDLRKGTAEKDQELYNYIIEEFGVTPAPTDTYWEKSGKNPAKYEDLYLADPKFGGNKAEAIQVLRQGRAGEGNDASRNFSAKDYDEMNKTMQIKGRTDEVTGDSIPDPN